MNNDSSASTEILLEWPAHPAAGRYRVALRDDTLGAFAFTRVTRSPRLSIATGELDPTHAYRWKVGVELLGRSGWQELRGYQTLILPAEPDEPVTRIAWEAASGCAAYRVVIRDHLEIRVKDVVSDPHYVVRWKRLPAAPHWHYRIQIADGAGGWRNLTDYRPLRPPGGTSSGISVKPREADEAPRTGAPELLFLFTVDTEANLRYMLEPSLERAVDAHVFGVCPDGTRCGIERMMDSLDQAGFVGTFFIDVLMEHQFGREGLERTIDAIRSRGHDLQLHLHTSPHLLCSTDPALRVLAPAMFDQDGDGFRRVLDLAIRTFDQLVGRPPIAYRAGSYHIQRATFRALAEAGIRIDSSIYPFKNSDLPGWMRVASRPFEVDGVLEIPVSWFVEQRGAARRAYQFNLRAGSEHTQLELAKGLLRSGEELHTLVFMAHSYSLLRENREHDDATREAWNEAFRRICPPDIFAQRRQTHERVFMTIDGPCERRLATMDNLLRGLAADPRVRGVSFSTLAEQYADRLLARCAPADPFLIWDHHSKRADHSGTRRYSLSRLKDLEAVAGAAS